MDGQSDEESSTRLRVNFLTIRLVIVAMIFVPNRGLQQPLPLPVKKTTLSHPEFSSSNVRRSIVFSSLAWLTAEPAAALQERNEALCGTGFFTNIAQYMCTEIGDISDEGKPRKVSAEEMGSMDSLMDKLGVSDGEDSESTQSSFFKNDRKDNEGNSQR